MNLTIRKADVSDANLISALGATTFYEAYFETDEPRHIGDYIVRTYDPEQIKSELEDGNSTFFIPEIEGKAVGFAKLREESVPECLKGENTVELQRIYLVERVWRKGIGKILAEKCLAEAEKKGFESVWLGVWEENYKAQRFYQKIGFKKVGEYRYMYEEVPAINFVFKKSVQ